MSTIVAVDDARVELAIYEHILSGLNWSGGVKYFSFESAPAGLDWLNRNDADLAIVDYDMPSASGFDVVEGMRASLRHRETPIVMITAITAHDIRYKALQLGANDFLTKPIDRVEFIARARNMLALSDGRKKLANRAAWLSEEVTRATADIVRRERETIHRLTRAAEFRDNETGAHIVRMGHFCAEIANELGADARRCDMLLMAAPMHDVGKVATPDSILLKPGPLTPDEWEIMKQHTIHGYEILRGSDSELLQLAGEIAVSHHEKFDGSGYPHGLSGDSIPMSGRICAISDVFDALTSKRPYKEEWPAEAAVDYIMDASGKHFDPKVVTAFRAAIPQIIALKKQFADPVTKDEAFGAPVGL